VAEIEATGSSEGTVGEVFRAFLRMGLTCFGGPIAHIGYFRDEFVLRRGWLDETAFGDLVALCQFLPGPASSQLGFAIGLRRGGGLAGGLAAWLGFTLPSAVALVALAKLVPAVAASSLGAGIIHGLKLAAVAVVAQAVFGMARSLTPDAPRAAIALLAVAFVAITGSVGGQIAGIAAGALLGLWLCRTGTSPPGGHLVAPVDSRAAAVALVFFAVLLALALIPVGDNPALAFIAAIYRSGALVFGGGHVVLPLLKAGVVPQWVTNADFLTGYGLAQAVPGPLFTFAAWLGFMARPFGGVLIAAVALVAIFLPGLLLVYGVLPFWNRLRGLIAAEAALRGANAAVVGILASALYDPVWTGAVADVRDFALALAGVLALIVWRLPPWLVVLLLAVAGAARTMLGL